jgi:hypothetical protein
MAFTKSSIAQYNVGNQRVHHIRVTADAASGTVDTDLNNIVFAQHSAQSCASGSLDYRVFINSDEANSNTVAGQVGVSGIASGDVIFLTVWGN